ARVRERRRQPTLASLCVADSTPVTAGQPSAFRFALLLGKSQVEAFDVLREQRGDFAVHAGAHADYRVRALRDHIALPDAFLAFWCCYFVDRFETERSFSRVPRRSGKAWHRGTRFFSRVLPAAAAATTTATTARLVLRLVDLERPAAHVIAVQALDRLGGIGA